MGWTINQSYDINMADASEWNNRSIEELKQMHKVIHAKFNDAQILINALNALDTELSMEIQERELHPEGAPTATQVFGQGPIMAPTDAIQF